MMYAKGQNAFGNEIVTFEWCKGRTAPWNKESLLDAIKNFEDGESGLSGEKLKWKLDRYRGAARFMGWLPPRLSLRERAAQFLQSYLKDRDG
jgi:hypothetical protein